LTDLYGTTFAFYFFKAFAFFIRIFFFNLENCMSSMGAIDQNVSVHAMSYVRPSGALSADQKKFNYSVSL
jgi:hypothetical protein